MLIALLAVLGVDLIVLVVFAAIVLGRRRWLKGQAGEFFGAARVTRGEVQPFTFVSRAMAAWVLRMPPSSPMLYVVV